MNFCVNIYIKGEDYFFLVDQLFQSRIFVFAVQVQDEDVFLEIDCFEVYILALVFVLENHYSKESKSQRGK